jgi:molybdopterin molybdotransferase
MSDTRDETKEPVTLTPAAAARAILADIDTLPVECIPLLDALGRILVSSVPSPINLPHWDNAAMDGYAVRSVDLADGDDAVELSVIEEIPAGGFPTKALGPGECTRIFTGAPVPKEADSVIRQEDTTRVAHDRVRVESKRDAGRNVRKRGEDITRGSTVLERGTSLGPAELGVLASVASTEVYVYRRPRIAILATGDEIAELDEREAILNGQKIASSNTYTIFANARLAGAEPINLGIARDDPDEIRRRVSRASTADLLVTSGAVSVGEHDYLRQVLHDQGLDLKFWRIRMRPGAPVGFGFVRGLPWIGLPGNPVSTMVTFELFVRPAIRKMLGYVQPFRASTRVRAGERIETPAPLTHFLRVRLQVQDGALTANLTGAQGSGILTSMTKADALLIVPEEREAVEPGETLEAIILGEARHVEEPPF